MKKIVLLVGFFSLNFTPLWAQHTNSCGFVVPPKSKKNSLVNNFVSVYEAKNIVNNMLETIKWKENFTLQEQDGINNAYATIIQNKRWIVYDNNFLENIDSYASTKWASVSIMAHEMGHHYYNHVVSGKGSTLPTELEADAFSGFVMNKLGATLEQSTAAMQKVAGDRASSTHPAKKDRVSAITTGWNLSATEKAKTNTPTPIPTIPAPTSTNNGGVITNGNTKTPIENGNTSTNTVDATWIGLSVQSATTETIYLSDDGKKFQAVEIQAGQPFVFKFEIYNYGWIKLPYFNSSRIFKLDHGNDYTVIWNRRTKNWTVVKVPE